MFVILGRICYNFEDVIGNEGMRKLIAFFKQY